MIADTSMPDVIAQRRQIERRMPGIVQQELEFPIRQSLNRGRQIVVASPEGFARDLPHARLKPSVTSPAAISASSPWSKGWRRPALISSIICRSQASAFPRSQSFSSKTSSAGSASICFFTSSRFAGTGSTVANPPASGKARVNSAGLGQASGDWDFEFQAQVTEFSTTDGPRMPAAALNSGTTRLRRAASDSRIPRNP